MEFLDAGPMKSFTHDGVVEYIIRRQHHDSQRCGEGGSSDC